jgi:4-amino-4-deoxy-L-arabinose transferase-like glycosyltransferase
LSAAERLVFESEHESTAFVAQFPVLCAMNRSSMVAWWRQPLWYLCLGWALVYLRGLWLDVMDVDASQYASISMEMLQNGHWLEVQHRGADYLDKPPLLFWLSAGAFRVLGYSNWAYKLPSFLFALAGIAATYRFARLFYPENTARWAAMMLGSSIGLLLLCNDVRTDTLLLGTSACAVWQLAAYQQSRRWAPLWAAFFFIGLAMLAKGPGPGFSFADAARFSQYFFMAMAAGPGLDGPGTGAHVLGAVSAVRCAS